MTLSSAMSAATSGLRVTSIGARVVADNISNAQTEGYGLRTLQLSAQSLGRDGAGVRVAAVVRQVDQATIDLLRDARTSASGADRLARFHTSLETLVGLPGDAQGLTTRFDSLEESLRSALGNPASDTHLSAVAQAGSDLARTIRDIGSGIDRMRDDADAAIHSDVGSLQVELDEIARLQVQISKATALGHPTSAFEDQRAARIDAISDLLPVRDIRAPDGRLMLLGADGTILADRQAALISFSRTVAPQPHESMLSGDLSALLVNGRAATNHAEFLGQGRLAGNFAIRDDLGLKYRQQIDQLAHDLTIRAADPGGEPSPSGAFYGIFRLGALTTWPDTLAGLANAIVLDPQLSPDGGQEFWRLREGSAASSPNAPNQTSLLQARLQGLLSAGQALLTPIPVRQQDVGTQARDLTSFVAMERMRAEDHGLAARGRLSALTELRAGQGVDPDAQLQALMAIEQSYAANAKVIATVDGLLKTLLEL